MRLGMKIVEMIVKIKKIFTLEVKLFSTTCSLGLFPQWWYYIQYSAKGLWNVFSENEYESENIIFIFQMKCYDLTHV